MNQKAVERYFDKLTRDRSDLYDQIRIIDDKLEKLKTIMNGMNDPKFQKYADACYEMGCLMAKESGNGPS